MKKTNSAENEKPTAETLIEIISNSKKLDCWLKSFKKNVLKNKAFTDWEDIAYEAEQYIQNFKWNKNEVCKLLKRLDHDKVLSFMIDKEDDFLHDRLLEKATIQRCAELLNYYIYLKDHKEANRNWIYKIENNFSKREIENRNKLCNSLKEINHRKFVKKIISLKDKVPWENLFEDAVLECQKDINNKTKTLKMKCK